MITPFIEYAVEKYGAMYEMAKEERALVEEVSRVVRKEQAWAVLNLNKSASDLAIYRAMKILGQSTILWDEIDALDVDYVWLDRYNEMYGAVQMWRYLYQFKYLGDFDRLFGELWGRLA